MTLPDIATLNRLCAEEAASGPCADGNCDACVISRTMARSHGVRVFVENAIGDIERASDLQRVMVSCIAAGFALALKFKAEKTVQ